MILLELAIPAAMLVLARRWSLDHQRALRVGPPPVVVDPRISHVTRIPR